MNKSEKIRKHMMITKINGIVNVSVPGDGGLNSWRNYFKVTEASKERLEKLMNSKEYRIAVTFKGLGVLVSVVRE